MSHIRLAACRANVASILQSSAAARNAVAANSTLVRDGSGRARCDIKGMTGGAGTPHPRCHR
jgi:hypothetical protein